MLKLKCESLVDLSKVKSVDELKRGKPVARIRLPSGDGVYLSVVEDMRGKYFGSSAFEDGKNGIPLFSTSVYDVGNLCGNGAWEVSHILWNETLNFLADGDIRMFSDKQKDCRSEYNGTLVITDPCYLDTGNVNFGYRTPDKLRSIGLKHFDVADTIYGDWSCTVFDIKKERPVGKFAADGGMVFVGLMEEIERSCKDFPSWAESHDWCVAQIPDFDGEAYIVHVSLPADYDGKADEVAYVVALGSHNLVGEQTGL